jgi:FAD-binding domain
MSIGIQKAPICFNHECNNIAVDELIANYKYVMSQFGEIELSSRFITTHLQHIQISFDKPLVYQDRGKDLISYEGFIKTLKWYIAIQRYYNSNAGNIGMVNLDMLFNKINIRKYTIVVVAVFIDLTILYALQSDPISQLHALTFTHIIYCMIVSLHSSSLPFMSSMHMLAFSKTMNITEYNCFYQWISNVCLYTLIVVLVISSIIFDDRLLITIGSSMIVGLVIFQSYIKWEFIQNRLRQSPYEFVNTSIGATINFLTICILVKQATFNIVLLASIIGVPMIIMRTWVARTNIWTYRLTIQQVIKTDAFIKLVIREDNSLHAILDTFGTAVVNCSYPPISCFEIHPFTLSRGISSKSASIIIRRVGQWTNSFAEKSQDSNMFRKYINVNSYSQSKFQLHNQYEHRYFFCHDCGIMAFITMAMDMQNVPLRKSIQTVLIWVITDITILHQFNAMLQSIKSQWFRYKIMIYYSNPVIKELQPEIIFGFEYLQTIMFARYNIDILARLKLPCTISIDQVNPIALLSTAVMVSFKNGVDHLPIGVFACGNNEFNTSIAKSVDHVRQNVYSVRFHLWSDLF